MKHDALKEKALANFELLLEFWKVDYRRITEREYDLLATWREDKNFGSCRFNTEKGIGADFACSGFSKEDFKFLGTGFDENDFSGFTPNDGATKPNFDIVGLCQRVYRCRTYQDASKYLDDDLRTLAKGRGIVIPSEEEITKKKKQRELKQQRILNYAKDLWESAKYYSILDTVGHKYLNSRGIYKLDKNIRFHPSIQYGPLRVNYPALLFKIQRTPEDPIQAIHRIYLDPSGTKAKVENPKMALASIKGGAIWLGEFDNTLYVAEGPENALTCLERGAKFVACTVFASNFHNLVVPSYVNKLMLIPDPDPAGIKYLNKLIEEKRNLCKISNLKIDIINIPIEKKPNGKYKDLNDLHLEG